MRSRTARIALVAMMGLTLVGVCGCSPGTFTTNKTGVYVTDETVNELYSGRSDMEWVRIMLGEPTSTSRGVNGGSTWVYEFRATRLEHVSGAEEEWKRRDTTIRFNRDGSILGVSTSDSMSEGWER